MPARHGAGHERDHGCGGIHPRPAGSGTPRRRERASSPTAARPGGCGRPCSARLPAPALPAPRLPFVCVPPTFGVRTGPRPGVTLYYARFRSLSEAAADPVETGTDLRERRPSSHPVGCPPSDARPLPPMAVGYSRPVGRTGHRAGRFDDGGTREEPPGCHVRRARGEVAGVEWSYEWISIRSPRRSESEIACRAIVSAAVGEPGRPRSWT